MGDFIKEHLFHFAVLNFLFWLTVATGLVVFKVFEGMMIFKWVLQIAIAYFGY